MNKTKRINIFRESMKEILEGLEEIIEYLDENNFFTAPASSKYHGCYEGGLFDHSWAVMETLVELTENNKLEWENDKSPYIVGMFHDLCKMNEYTKEKSTWDSEGKYIKNESGILKGHGEKSVMILASIIRLTEEEICCIRYHMGAYERDVWNNYNDAIKKYSNVLWTHHADMMVSKIAGI